MTAADWRGQAGSGRLGGDDRRPGIVDDLGAVGRAISPRSGANGRANGAGPQVLVGHSMGGHLVLRAVAERALEPAPAALLLSAPMLDVLPERVPAALRHALARAMCGIGDPLRPGWRWSERPGEVPRARQGLLTHDAARYADELWWRARGRSWRWGRAAGAGCAPRWPRSARWPGRGCSRAVDLPIYIVATSTDRLVGARAIARAAARLPRARNAVVRARSAHEILREVDSVRDRALAGIDRFLEGISSP